MRPMRNVSFAVLAMALALPYAGQAAEPRMMPSHDQEGADPPCTVSPDWFKSDAPEASFVLEDTNCAFHKWAVQEFLYLVQTDTTDPEKKTRFLNMASPHALFLYKGDKPKPHPGGSDTQFKLGAGMASLRSGQGESNAAPRVVFLPRTLKTENTTFNADTQAGSNAVLIDQKGQVVYYTAQINKVYYDFVVKQEYYKLDTLLKAPPEIAFPVGTVQVKSSWRIAKKGDVEYINKSTRDKYYTVEGTVCQDKDCKSMVPAIMALVGLHVVGRVQDHPEMVWATFEHYTNAPDCNRTPFPSGDLSFYAPNMNCGKGPFWENCNQIRKDDWTTPSEICRVHPNGEPGTTGNTANITSITASYAKLAPDSVWKNYFYVGAVWTDRMPDEPPKTLINLSDANIRGSKKAANTSMESFNITQEKNCLHCHTYQPPALTYKDGKCSAIIDQKKDWKNLYVSHLFGLLCPPKK